MVWIEQKCVTIYTELFVIKIEHRHLQNSQGSKSADFLKMSNMSDILTVETSQFHSLGYTMFYIFWP